MRLILSLLSFLSIFPLFAWDSFKEFPPLEKFYHPITTTSSEAQEAFNRGLLAIYAFNYDEAVRSFDEASGYDPNCAMAYWGMALALDQNLNPTVTPIHARLTMLLLQKALALKDRVTENEQAYIQALKERFSIDPEADKNKLRQNFKTAMGLVAKAFPDDFDASVLYAESVMDTLHWELWKSDKRTPYEGTEEALAHLRSVLIKDPWHPGANHYFIHAVEDSSTPERGLISAYRLDAQNFSEWGHLLHTTSHIYLRVGDYEKAVQANKKGIAADREYIKKYGIEGQYPLKYLAHNFYFLTLAYMWQERYEEAITVAQELSDLVIPHLDVASTLEYNLVMPLVVNLYFHKWDELLKAPEPEAKYEITKLFWMFTRAVAYAELGDREKMKQAKDAFINQKKWMVEKKKMTALKEGFDIAEFLVAASVAKAEGNVGAQKENLKKAIERQDVENYLAWYYPIRQTLGGCLLETNQFEEAEAVFREGLKECPRNGRLLFGLKMSLVKQNRFDYWAEREMKEALRFSNRKLQLKDL